MTAKVYIMTFVCPVSKLLNLQVIESKSADGIDEGLTRFACESGFPYYLLVDRESSVMKVMREAEVNLRDMQLVMQREYGVRFQVAREWTQLPWLGREKDKDRAGVFRQGRVQEHEASCHWGPDAGEAC